MATETDLRDLLVELEDGAPTVRDVLDGLALDKPHSRTAARRRRPAWAVTGAVAACVAVAVGVGALSLTASEQDSTTGPSARTAALRAELLPSWRFAVAPVPGYTVERDSIIRMDPVTSVAQQASVGSTSTRVTGHLEVSVPASAQSLRRVGNFGEVAAGELGPRRALTINGRRAYYFHPTALSPRELDSTHGDEWAAASEYIDNQPQLYWQLPGRAVAELSGTFGFRPASATWDGRAALAALKEIAAATTYSSGQAVTVPFRLNADPHGFIPLGASLQPHSECIGYGTGTQVRPTDPNWNWYDVCRHTGARPSDETGPTVATRRLPDGTSLTLVTGGWPGQAKPITRAEGRRILRDADVTPVVADPSTWLPIQ
jgi:hypothetical protein